MHLYPIDIVIIVAYLAVKAFIVARGFEPDAGVLPLYAFPLLLVISVIGCLAGTLLTKPEDDEVLKNFYKRVRPWGFWGPVLAKVKQDEPSFEPNNDSWRDVLNIAVGVVCQVALVALPIYLVIKKFDSAAVTLAVVAVTSVILKFTWYDHLNKEESLLAAGEQERGTATTA